MSRIERLEKIRKEINNWDPIGLLEIGAPKNEYEQEIVKISSKIMLENNKDKLGEIIYEIFLEMFDDCVFNKTIEECVEIAEKIINN